MGALELSALSSACPCILGQQDTPLLPLHGGILMPSPVRRGLVFALSQNRDEIGSRLCLTSCSVALCLKKSEEELHQVFSHKLKGEKGNLRQDNIIVSSPYHL